MLRPGPQAPPQRDQQALTQPAPALAEDALAELAANREPQVEGQLAVIMREAALQDFKVQVEASEACEVSRMYMCRVPPEALMTLTHRLQPNRPKPELPGGLQQKMRKPSLLFFSVLATNPSRAKSALQGVLQTRDMAVSIHDCMDVCKPHVYVATTPMSFSQTALGDAESQQLSLVLTTQLFPLVDLQNSVRMDVASEIMYLISGFKFEAANSKLLAALTSTSAGLQVEGSDAVRNGFLKKWQARLGSNCMSCKCSL